MTDRELSIARQPELAEARLLLRYAMQDLGTVQRAAITALVMDRSNESVAAEIGVSRSAVWEARVRALGLMRRRLATLGIFKTSDLLSGVELISQKGQNEET
jgi:DNA-directed RNA polymerase specialized sigma24 family protein